MRSSFFTILIMVMTALPAMAQEPQPGDACPVTDRFMRVAGPENPGSGHFLFCDSSLVWQPVMRFLPDGHVLFNSGGTPAAPLHVWGEVIIGSQGLGCDGASEGAQRYNSSQKIIQFCNGSNWCPIDGGCAPDTFAFTDQTEVSLSTLIESDVVQITGIDGTMETSIVGDGAPEYRICDAADCSSIVTNWTSAENTIQNGEYLQLRLTSNAAGSTTNRATITVGSGNDQWDVTTGHL